MNEKFWHKNFIDLNDKWHALQYNILLMKEAIQCKVDRLKLESFTGDGDVGLKEAKAEAEAYAAIYELMREMRNEDNKSEMSGQD
jgi:hypothetical protein